MVGPRGQHWETDNVQYSPPQVTGQSASSVSLQTIQTWKGLISKKSVLLSEGLQQAEAVGQQEPHIVQQMQKQSPALREEQPHAPVQAESQLTGNCHQLESCLAEDGLRTEVSKKLNMVQMCPCSKEGQEHPGLH